MKNILFDRFVQFREECLRLLREVGPIFCADQLIGFTKHCFQFRQQSEIMFTTSFVDTNFLNRLSSISHNFLYSTLYQRIQFN